MTYYIKVGAENWVELASFEFFAESPVDTSGEHSQTAPASFGAVTVNLASDALLSNLIEKTVLGTVNDIIIRATSDGKNGAQATYDMVLGEALIEGLDDNLQDGPTLQLTYGEIAITTYTDDGTGASVFDGSFDWDVVTSDGTPEAIPVIPGIKDLANEAPAVSPVKYVMAIDKVGGASGVDDRTGWFDITDFSYGMVKPQSSDAENFGFSVTVADQTSLTSLMSLAASGKLISAVEIQGLSLTDTVDTKTLFGNVSIESIIDNDGNGYSVNFSYDAINSTVFESKAEITAKFDFTTGTEATITAPTPGVAFETAAPVAYFLALRDLTGDSSATGHEGWFRVDGISLGLDTSGFQAEMNTVGLVLKNDTEIADIMALVLNDTALKNATVRGIDGNGSVVYTLDMGDVAIESLIDRSGGGFDLNLDFHQVQLDTKGFDAFGALKNNPSFGWDFDTNSALASLASAKPGSTTPGTSVTPEKFYMIVEGMNGGSADPAHKGWFELTDFDFAAINSDPDPELSPVSTVLAGDMGLTAMIKAATMGSAIKGIRIEGVVEVGGIEKKVYDLALRNVQAENVSDSSVAGFSADFDYGAFSLRTFDAITGKLTGVTGWDRVAELASTKSVSVVPSTGNAEAQATDYVFAATGIKGESQIRVSPGFSDITGFSFGVSQPTLEGVSQGNSEPSTLTLTFATDTALPDLLFNMTQGKFMENASLLGLANIGGDKGLQKVFSIDLARVLVTAVNDFAGAGFSVDLDFVKFGITQTKINPLTAQLGGQNAFGWDDVLDQPAVVAGSSGGTKEQAVVPTRYVMAIDGFHGDLASVARGGWIEIAGMDFGGTNPIETKAGGGISSSKFDLNSITISVESDSGLTALLDYMTKGTPISGIQIEGSALDGANVEKTVQAYTLGEVYVASVVDREGPGYSVTLEAARFELLNFKLNGLPIGNPVGYNLEDGQSWGAQRHRQPRRQRQQ